MASVLTKLRGYSRQQPPLPLTAPTPPVPAATADSAAPTSPSETISETISEAPRSLLHARVSVWLGELVDRHVPARYLDLVRRMAPIVNSVRGVVPGLKQIPILPANLPGTPEALKAAITQQLNTLSPAQLAQVLTLAQSTAGAWLAEYAAALQPDPDPVPVSEESLSDESSSRDALA